MKLAKAILTAALFVIIGNGLSLPQTILQGGDNIDNAYVIPTVPFIDSGTTVGYTNDYDGNCGFGGEAPDVVYKYTPTSNMGIWADLCDGAEFFNKLYIFKDTPDSIIACSASGCYSGVAQIHDCVPLVVGHTYYFVVDGNGDQSGNYHINIETPSLPPPLSGTVTDYNDGPLVGALVRVLRHGVEVVRDTTIRYGHYGYGNLMPLAPDTYTVEVSKPTYITQESAPTFIGICQGEVVLDFALEREVPPPIGAISGIVSECDGTPIDRFPSGLCKIARRFSEIQPGPMANFCSLKCNWDYMISKLPNTPI